MRLRNLAKPSRLLVMLATAALVPMFAMPQANATVTIGGTIDAQWIVQYNPGSSTCTYKVSVQVSTLVAGVGYYKIHGVVENIPITGSSDYVPFDSGPIFIDSVSNGIYSNTQTVYASGCYNSANAGNAWVYAYLDECNVDCGALTGSRTYASDDAYCDWGWDAYCDTETGT